MILPTGVDLARKMTAEFTAGTVRKVYVARANGRFPEYDFVISLAKLIQLTLLGGNSFVRNLS